MHHQPTTQNPYQWKTSSTLGCKIEEESHTNGYQKDRQYSHEQSIHLQALVTPSRHTSKHMRTSK